MQEILTILQKQNLINLNQKPPLPKSDEENYLDWFNRICKELLIIKQCAEESDKMIEDVHYCVLNNKIVYLDQNTGLAQRNTTFCNYLHGMLEIRHGVTPRSPGISSFVVAQVSFFKKYQNIAGVTGTLVDESDIKTLRDCQKVYVFHVLRHFGETLKLRTRKRPSIKEELFQQVNEEAFEVSNAGRPALIIFQSKLEAEQHIKKIIWIYINQDEQAIQTAGEPGMITVATNIKSRN